MIKKYRPKKELLAGYHFKLAHEGATLTELQAGHSLPLGQGSLPAAQLDPLPTTHPAGIVLPSNSAFLFSIPLEHAFELDCETIPEVVHREFRALEMPLSQSAQVSVQQRSTVWIITDRNRSFSVRMVPTGLLIYNEG